MSINEIQEMGNDLKNIELNSNKDQIKTLEEHADNNILKEPHLKTDTNAQPLPFWLMSSRAEETEQNSVPRDTQTYFSSYIPDFIKSGITTTMQYISKSNEENDIYDSEILLKGDISFASLDKKFQNIIIKESQDFLKKNLQSYYIIEKFTSKNKALGVCNAKSFYCPVPLINKSVSEFINGTNSNANENINPSIQETDKKNISQETSTHKDSSTEIKTTIVYLTNSLLLPGSSVSQFYHEKSWLSKIAMGVKDHYNLQPQRHLYLKNNASSESIYFGNSKSKENANINSGKKITIVSVSCDLPETYMLRTVVSVPESQELSENLKAALLQNNSNCQIETLSISLKLQSIEFLIDQVIEILHKQKELFNDIEGLFFVGFYHTVPVIFAAVERLLKEFKSTRSSSSPNLFKTDIGLWGIQSCLSNQTFFEHSSDIDSNKKLYANCSKQEQDILKNIHKYSSSTDFLNSVNWICKKSHVKITLTSSMYDNFMTISQKLGINFIHPNIMRNIWVDCNTFDATEPYVAKYLKTCDQFNSNMDYQSAIPVPPTKLFEISLINSLILSLDLGQHIYASTLLQKIAPFFISRSFNENTYPNVLRKKIDKELKEWLAKIERENPNWKSIVPTVENLKDYKNKICGSFSLFMEFLKYKSLQKEILIKKEIYHDSKIYTAFIENTLFTSKLIDAQNIKNSKSLEIKDIFDQNSQYEVVWSFHEFLSKFVQFNNLPVDQGQNIQTNLTLSLKFKKFEELSGKPDLKLDQFNNLEDDLPESPSSSSSKTEFVRNTVEAHQRVRKLYNDYWVWEPSVKGLKLLKNICSVMEMYTSSDDFIRDINV